MKKITAIVFLLILSINLFSQTEREKDKQIIDSIRHNKYNEGNIYIGGGIGGGLSIKSPGFKFTSFSITNTSSLGYFVTNRNAIMIKNNFQYSTYTYEQNKGVDVWHFYTTNSLVFRHYFKERKLNFFVEADIDCFSFYENDYFYTNRPPKWNHAGMLSPGIGGDLVVYRFNLSLTVLYNFPILYKEEVTNYDVFHLLGQDYVLQLSYTF